MYGFSIVDDVDISIVFCSNYKSATQGDAKVIFDNLFYQELDEFKYVKTDVVPHCVHAIGAVPITDCRRPLGVSINNFMDLTYNYFKFQTLDDVCNRLQPNMFMARYCFRSVSVNKDHGKYQGVCWKFSIQQNLQCTLDTRLCFGLRRAPYIFSVISDSVARRGFHNVFSYLDDFLFLGD